MGRDRLLRTHEAGDALLEGGRPLRDCGPWRTHARAGTILTDPFWSSSSKKSRVKEKTSKESWKRDREKRLHHYTLENSHTILPFMPKP